MKYYTTNKPTNKLLDLMAGSSVAYKISRPAEVNATDVTRYQFNIIKHPTREDWAAIVSDVQIPINDLVIGQANKGGINGHSEFYENPGDVGRIRSVINPSANGLVSLYDLIPNRWQERTERYMMDNGWFE